MRLLIYILIISIFITSCVSSKKYFEQGQYGQALNISVQKLRKKPTNKKEAEILEKSYNLANNLDLEQIVYLKQEGQPDRWEKIFALYSQMKDRQTFVKTVLPLHIEGRTIDFAYVNYDNEIITAKNNAADYFYNHGKQLMKLGTKQGYRDAYYEFEKTKQYSASYLEVDKLMNEAGEKGTAYAILIPKSSTLFRLSDNYLNNLINFDMSQFNGGWIRFSNQIGNRNSYDYNIFVIVQQIKLSPEKIERVINKRTRKIEDGWEYELDGRGNVKKDSTGKDIKRQKYKNISCDLIETFQERIAHIEGVVQYQNNNNNEIIRSRAIAADNIFRFSSFIANGDQTALSDDERNLIKNRPLPIAFPNDMDMINAASDALKKSIYDAIQDSRKFLENN